jgi:hypothetical protein
LGSYGGLKIEEIISTYDEWFEEEMKNIDLTMHNFNIYCDLDGVLADFDKGVFKLFNRRADEISPKILWSKLASEKNFFNSLPWTEDGKFLWNHISMLNPIILTGCPRGDWAKSQKYEWCSRELGVDVQVITCSSREKAQFCVPVGSILIDDRKISEESWIAAGGNFILHRSATETLDRLREVLNDKFGFTMPNLDADISLLDAPLE